MSEQNGLSEGELRAIGERVKSLIDGPHTWPMGKEVKCVQYENENCVELARLLHEDVPALLAELTRRSALDAEVVRVLRGVETLLFSGSLNSEKIAATEESIRALLSKLEGTANDE